MSSKEKTHLVSARGTLSGLSLCIETSASDDMVLKSVRDFVSSRVTFLKGNEVTVEWKGERRDSLASSALRVLREEFDIDAQEVSEEDGETASAPRVSRKRLSLAVPSVFSETKVMSDEKEFPGAEDEELGLFGGLSSLGSEEGADALGKPAFSRASSVGGNLEILESSQLWDDPDARIVYETLRSGQRLESEHSVIVVGDVNSGAEVVSGGDVVVLGRLRGVAHAGAFEESGGRRFIFALELDPTQLRIGSVISRGDESRGASSRRELRPEVARVDTDRIVVEEYTARPRFSRNAGNF